MNFISLLIICLSRICYNGFMGKYEQLIGEVIKSELGVTVDVELTRPESKFGDYATNAILPLAKKLGKNPRELAEVIANSLRATGEFIEVTVAGPGFINLRIAAKVLAENLREQFAQSQPFGTSNANTGKVAVVEYPSPNMAKPYSVGHLRSGNQGWAAKNLLESQGWKVITDNHLGDSGSPFGYWVLGYKLYSSPEKLAKDGIYELGRVYIEIRAALKQEAERGETKLADEAQQWLLKLENHDSEAVHYSDEFSRISLDHIHAVMKRLGISTEYEYGEKFFEPFGKAAISRVLKDGIANENADGSVIIDLADQGIKTPFLIRKSNGASLYATGDLACLLWREENWHPDMTVYSVGGEQKFYFEQIAAVAKKLELKQKIFHLWFGTIDQIDEDGKRAKMSSRKGVVLLEQLLDFAFERARENAKSDDLSDNDLRKISIGAIKFADFSADRRTGMLFDWNTIFSLTGFSGPYVQYAAVRVNKILRDNPIDDSVEAKADYAYEAEKNLILKALEYPGVVKLAAEKLEPHRVAGYLFELAKTLNKYYETTSVATVDVPGNIKKNRLEFLMKIATIFERGLDLLGIGVPEKM